VHDEVFERKKSFCTKQVTEPNTPKHNEEREGKQTGDQKRTEKKQSKQSRIPDTYVKTARPFWEGMKCLDGPEGSTPTCRLRELVSIIEFAHQEGQRTEKSAPCRIFRTKGLDPERRRQRWPHPTHRVPAQWLPTETIHAARPANILEAKKGQPAHVLTPHRKEREHGHHQSTITTPKPQTPPQQPATGRGGAAQSPPIHSTKIRPEITWKANQQGTHERPPKTPPIAARPT